MFLQNAWMRPIRVSTAGVDSRDPQLLLQSDCLVTVIYMTPTGMQTRFVTIPDTTSITDDIDPKIRTEISVN
jgi:hypothetical protein